MLVAGLGVAGELSAVTGMIEFSVADPTVPGLGTAELCAATELWAAELTMLVARLGVAAEVFFVTGVIELLVLLETQEAI